MKGKGKASGKGYMPLFGLMTPSLKPGKITGPMYDLMAVPKALPQKAHKRTENKRSKAKPTYPDGSRPDR
jgi:hypothetical protein